jgi:hypothetical protein
MQCDVHKDKVAVGFCEACGRMVCRDCAVVKDGRMFCREDAAKLETMTAPAPVPAPPVKRTPVSATVLDVKSTGPAYSPGADISGAEPASSAVVTAKVIERAAAPAPESFRVETIQRPADNVPAPASPPGEEMTVKVLRSPLLFNLILVFLVVVLIGFLLICWISLVSSIMNPNQDISILLGLLFGNFAATVVLAVAAWKYHEKKTISPLFKFRIPGFRRNSFGVVLAGDGVYLEIGNNLYRRRYKWLPWDKVRILAVNEAEKRVGLKSGRYRFRLDGKDRFEELKSLVVRQAARGEPVNYVRKKTPLISVGRLAVILAVLAIAYLLIVAYVESGPAINVPGDGKCDYDGTPTTYQFYTIDAAGNQKTIHDICEPHLYLLSFLHPDLAWSQWSKLNPGFNVAVILSIFALLSVLAAALHFSVPRWRRTRRYVPD